MKTALPILAISAFGGYLYVQARKNGQSLKGAYNASGWEMHIDRNKAIDTVTSFFGKEHLADSIKKSANFLMKGN